MQLIRILFFNVFTYLFIYFLYFLPTVCKRKRHRGGEKRRERNRDKGQTKIERVSDCGGQKKLSEVK